MGRRSGGPQCGAAVPHIAQPTLQPSSPALQRKHTARPHHVVMLWVLHAVANTDIVFLHLAAPLSRLRLGKRALHLEHQLPRLWGCARVGGGRRRRACVRHTRALQPGPQADDPLPQPASPALRPPPPAPPPPPRTPAPGDPMHHAPCTTHPPTHLSPDLLLLRRDVLVAAALKRGVGPQHHVPLQHAARLHRRALLLAGPRARGLGLVELAHEDGQVRELLLGQREPARKNEETAAAPGRGAALGSWAGAAPSQGSGRQPRRYPIQP